MKMPALSFASSAAILSAALAGVWQFPVQAQMAQVQILAQAQTTAQTQAQAQAPTLPMRAGSYDVNTFMTIKGESSEPARDNRCLSKEQMLEVENIFNMRPMAGVCSVSKLIIRAGKISYSADCPNTDVQVSGVVGSDSYSVNRVQKPKQANGTEVITRFDGNFAGACRQ